MKRKDNLRKYVFWFDATLLSILTVLIGLWFIIFVDFNLSRYKYLAYFGTGVLKIVNQNLFLSGELDFWTIILAKFLFGVLPLALALVDLYAICHWSFGIRKRLKFLLITYWVQLFVFLGIPNFRTTDFPFFLFVLFFYIITFLRLPYND